MNTKILENKLYRAQYSSKKTIRPTQRIRHTRIIRPTQTTRPTKKIRPTRITRPTKETRRSETIRPTRIMMLMLINL